MDIVFENSDFEKQCNNHKLLVRKHGSIRAKRIRQRLDDLRAASSLDVMLMLPGRCHELKQDRAGQISLDLDHPYRLIFEPANHPVPLKEVGGLDWNNITAIMILGVDDTHG